MLLAHLEAATSVVAGDVFDDLEELEEPGRRSVTALRDGPPVRTVQAESPSAHDSALLKQIVEDKCNGVDVAGMAVLCHTNAQVASYRRRITRSGIRCVDLADYDGHPIAAVKVGTIKRAKGLEFDAVYLPLVKYGTPGLEAEAAQLLRREAFVGMTRARTLLWVGQLS